MYGQTFAIASGIILLVAFVVVGLKLWRKRAHKRTERKTPGHDSP